MSVLLCSTMISLQAHSRLLSTSTCTCIAPSKVSIWGRSFYVNPQQSSKIGGLNRPRHIWRIEIPQVGSHLAFLLQCPGRFTPTPSLYGAVIPAGIHVPTGKDLLRPNFTFIYRNGKCSLFLGEGCSSWRLGQRQLMCTIYGMPMLQIGALRISLLHMFTHELT